jgi:hypothetical protein
MPNLFSAMFLSTSIPQPGQCFSNNPSIALIRKQHILVQQLTNVKSLQVRFQYP